ncbi:MAG: signal peptide peptidase SppA [Ferruginibacter sp.]|nr:signal peptide peptidase SppA [Cytophagales bacterium]
MLQFFKYVLATLVGLLLFFVVGFFLLIGIAASFSSDPETTVATNSVLKLNLNRAIDETAADNPFNELNLPGFGNAPANAGLVQIKEALANARLDENIRGIYLEANYPAAGYATLEEIRNALLDFKKSGKFVFSYGEVYSEKGFYLSSVADQIYLNPAGLLELNGLSTEYTFFKGTLDKLEIKPEIFKVGDYKSAVEPFTREDMSEPSREQTLSFLNSLNDFAFQNIAQARGLSTEALNRIADSLSVQNPNDALRYKLVTHLGYFDQVETAMRKRLKVSEDKKIDYVTLSKYRKAPKLVKSSDSENRIAVIVASGEIVSGNGDGDNIGSDKIAAEIRKARLDKKVKAVVLRINSPGGSALASDVMWREVELTKQVKPIIASMSDVAASGGYYMAMGCNKIVAHPNTITGSIGVFGIIPNVENFLRNKLGITTDYVETNEYAEFPSATHEMTAFEKGIIQKSVEQTYDSFTNKAAQGRKMPQEAIKKIASGRVWSGAEAKQNGLVDELGGLEDAIRIAAQAAKLKADDYRVRYYPAPKSFVQEFLSDMNEENEARILRNQLGPLAPYAKALQKMQRLQGIQARLPFDVEIR